MRCAHDAFLPSSSMQMNAWILADHMLPAQIDAAAGLHTLSKLLLRISEL
jgi:hypothetical protein